MLRETKRNFKQHSMLFRTGLPGSLPAQAQENPCCVVVPPARTAVGHGSACGAGRLAIIGILDTLPKERFNVMVDRAARMFDVPVAAISLVDEHRQWFKARVSLDIAETARDISFCGHAIAAGKTSPITTCLAGTWRYKRPWGARRIWPLGRR
jgi:hypothetical protein